MTQVEVEVPDEPAGPAVTTRVKRKLTSMEKQDQKRAKLIEDIGEELFQWLSDATVSVCAVCRLPMKENGEFVNNHNHHGGCLEGKPTEADKKWSANTRKKVRECAPKK